MGGARCCPGLRIGRSRPALSGGKARSPGRRSAAAGRAPDIRHPLSAGLLTVFALSVATTGFWAYGPLLLATLFGTARLVSGYLLAGEALTWSAATMAIAAVPAAAGRLLLRRHAPRCRGSGWPDLAVPAGSLPGIILCQLLQGAGIGPVLASHHSAHGALRRGPGTRPRGSGTRHRPADRPCGRCRRHRDRGQPLRPRRRCPAVAARTAGFWVFAAFVPVLATALLAAWRFTAEDDRASRR